jgi:hypothetical protein
MTPEGEMQALTAAKAFLTNAKNKLEAALVFVDAVKDTLPVRTNKWYNASFTQGDIEAARKQIEFAIINIEKFDKEPEK